MPIAFVNCFCYLGCHFHIKFDNFCWFFTKLLDNVFCFEFTLITLVISLYRMLSRMAQRTSCMVVNSHNKFTFPITNFLDWSDDIQIKEHLVGIVICIHASGKFFFGWHLFYLTFFEEWTSICEHIIQKIIKYVEHYHDFVCYELDGNLFIFVVTVILNTHYRCCIYQVLLSIFETCFSNVCLIL